jgi:hypothetical protein
MLIPYFNFIINKILAIFKKKSIYMFVVCVMMKEFLGTKWLLECSVCDAVGTKKK